MAKSRDRTITGCITQPSRLTHCCGPRIIRVSHGKFCCDQDWLASFGAQLRCCLCKSPVLSLVVFDNPFEAVIWVKLPCLHFACLVRLNSDSEVDH